MNENKSSMRMVRIHVKFVRFVYNTQIAEL